MRTFSSDWNEPALRRAGDTELLRDCCAGALAYALGYVDSYFGFIHIMPVPLELDFSRAGRAQCIAAELGYTEDREVSEREAIAIDRIRLTITQCGISKPVFEIPDLIERELREIMRLHDIQVRAGLPTLPSWDTPYSAVAAAHAYVCLRKVKRLIKRALSGSHLANAAVVLACWHSLRLRPLLESVGDDLDARAIEKDHEKRERMRTVQEERYGTSEDKECRHDRIWEVWLKIRRLKKVSKTEADRLVAKLSPFSEMTVKRARSKREKEKLDREKLGH